MAINIIKSFIRENSLHRLALIRERGIQDRNLQQYVTSNKPTEQSINVSMVTVAPIFVVLAAGYLTGILVLMIERCAHGNVLKYWRGGTVRRPWQN